MKKSDKKKKSNHPFMLEIEKINDRLDQVVNSLTSKEMMETDVYVLSNQRLMEFFDVDSKEIESWRDTGMIGYSKIKNRYYYRLSDVNEMLSKYYCKE